MKRTSDLVNRLTSGALSTFERRRSLNDFAHSLGWTPSDQLEFVHLKDFSTAHLVVEHGLENAAVISFLSKPFGSLSRGQESSLVSVSYNNLVDWHICIDVNDATFLYNRVVPPPRRVINSDNFDQLRRDAFDEVVGRKPNPNIPALDDALIRTISYWKRVLSVEVEHSISNEALATLFNAIIFCRAVEDYRHRRQETGHVDLSGEYLTQEYLTEEYLSSQEHRIGRFLVDRASELLEGEIPEYIFSASALESFDEVQPETTHSLLRDFYRNRFAPYYRYDFAVISKHALSRIYERYVSILRPEPEGAQTTFLPPLPVETLDKATGNVYTPEFVAKFFGKIVRDLTPPRSFRNLRTMDPACGSGIFLRTLLEMQCDPAWLNGLALEEVERAYDGAWGIDIDPNAAQAARLSLALLHLVLTGGRLPRAINIVDNEALAYLSIHQEIKGSFDVAIANPPFVTIERQPDGIRFAIDEFLGALKSGRVDSYLAFLYLGYVLLKEGGLGLFVLPHSFLLADSGAPLRRLLRENTELLYLVDLSQAGVFEGVGAYVILLAFRKKTAGRSDDAPMVVAQARADVGSALQATLNQQETETPYYSVHVTDQRWLSGEQWIIRAPSEDRVLSRLATFPPISNFVDIKQGYVSGADDVFFLDASEVPAEERAVFVTLVPDREIHRYLILETSDVLAFYPYLNDDLVSEDLLHDDFPWTWNYLLRHRKKLEGRSQVRKGNLPWWKPERPRPPKNLLRPKLVSPHLVLGPKFAIDPGGMVAVTHSPMFMIAPSLLEQVPMPESELLKYFLAILNSSVSFWFVTAHSHTYDRGYSMLEPKTLVHTPVPDPRQLRPGTFRSLISLVDERLRSKGRQATDLEASIDEVVAALYGLPQEEKDVIGIRANG